MKLIVIESPYAGAVEENVEYARRCMKDALGRNEAPIASHLLYTQAGILDDTVAEERALGIGAGLAWAELATTAVFYLDRGVSGGMRAALDFYNERGIETIFRSLDGDLRELLKQI